MQDISIDGLTASEQAQVFAQTAPVSRTTARNGMPLYSDEYERVEAIENEQLLLRKTARNRKAYDVSNAGSLSYCFGQVQSPNIRAMLRKSYRESKRIMYVDCLLCENNACHGIMHYRVLPLNAFDTGCSILRCQRDIATLEETINKQKEQINTLKALARESDYRQARTLLQQARQIDEQIAPITRKIQRYRQEIEDKQLELLPIELAINDIGV